LSKTTQNASGPATVLKWYAVRHCDVNADDSPSAIVSTDPNLRPRSPFPKSRCSCVCGSPISDVGSEFTQMNPCGADSILR
jgi:hypothetical protein